MTDSNTPERGEPTSPELPDDPRAQSNEWPAPQGEAVTDDGVPAEGSAPVDHDAYQPPTVSFGEPAAAPVTERIDEPSDEGEPHATSEDATPADEHPAPADETAPVSATEADTEVIEPAAAPRPWTASSPTSASAPASAPAPAATTAAAPTSSPAPTAAPTSSPAPASATTAAPTSSPAPASAPAASTGSTASAAEAERPLTPLSPPSEAPASAPGTSTGALHDDSALRAAEAVRSGERQDPAPLETPTQALSREDLPSGDVDDTRITAPGQARSTTAWTPPPAPASPTEQIAAPTPTPYAPPSTQAMPVAGASTQANTTTPANTPTQANTQVLTPGERLGFGDDGIAGGDDGFTPAEMASRRAFRDEIAFRQKQEFAGISFGAAFFGWLAAVGLAGLLYVILGAVGVATGVSAMDTSGGSLEIGSIGTALTADAASIAVLVAFLVVLFVSYFVGGYVASRMARFSGLKQGLAVWLWGLVATIVVAVIVVVIVSQNSDVISSMNVSSDPADYITPQALIAEGLIIVLSIGGALLGGLAGQRFHRRVDRFGFEEV